MSTIASISTAPGIGGIGIIRMSGEKSFEILEKIFEPKTKQNIEEIKGYTIKYGNIIFFQRIINFFDINSLSSCKRKNYIVLVLKFVSHL